ncbi:SagB family peptide dehydrogenase [Streptomyces sp. NPDC014894]|uniref:SagB family peptide dehydrogenase n=1 Tax=Streptomyces sp. NPDC014894 TaxID=3364931 RepID=UPI0037006DA8
MQNEPGAGGEGDQAVSFAADVRLHPDDDRLVVHRAPRSYVLRGLPPALRDVLCGLARDPLPLPLPLPLPGDRAAAEPASGRAARHPDLTRVLERLSHLLVRDVRAPGGGALLRVEPLRALPLSLPPPVAAGTPVRLSRFALLRADDGDIVLESPRSPARLRLTGDVARAAVLRLAEPRTAEELPGLVDRPRDPAATPAVMARLAGLLTGLGLAETAGPGGEEDDPALRQWDFHELLFAGRSTPVRDTLPRFLNELPPQPALRPYPPGSTRVPLSRPELADLLRDDPSLTAALESRRSWKRYGDEPVTARALGEFLYRTARVRGRLGERPGPYYAWDARPLFERTSRPYPGTDGIHELELYVTVRRCDGLPAGTYHYDPLGHALVPVEQPERTGEALIRRVGRWHRAAPDLLITVTSRVRRLSWNYGAIAYALTLQHLGVLHQTMYLVATAMGLAPCALRGVAEPDTVAGALGLDGIREVVLGEFLLGTRPEDGSSPGGPPDASGWEPVNSADWAHRVAAGPGGHESATGRER